MDAFVALGGSADKQGSIDAKLLVDIIKRQFEMTIDIEGFLKEIDSDDNGTIDFQEFQQLLSSDNKS